MLKYVQSYTFLLIIINISNYDQTQIKPRKICNNSRFEAKKQLPYLDYSYLYLQLVIDNNQNSKMQQIPSIKADNLFCHSSSFLQNGIHLLHKLDQFKHTGQQKKQNDNQTNSSPQPNLIKKINFNSVQDCGNQCSIQQNFMTEHFEAFQKFYQNYIDSFDIQHKQKQNKNSFLNLQEQKSIYSLLDILRQQELSFQLNKFVQDLRKQSKFYELLNFIVSLCKRQLTIGFISILQFVWNSYQKMESQPLSIKKIMKTSQEWIEKNIANNLSNHFKQNSQEQLIINEQMIILMQVYCSTILLILNGYFQNPYLQKENKIDNCRRLFNDAFDSDSDSSCSLFQNGSSKIRKLSH